MSYLFALLFFGVLGLMYFSATRRKRRRKKLEELEFIWGKTKEEYFDFNLITKYAAQDGKEEAIGRLPEQTLLDIDFQDIFKFLDRTCSKPGQQYLYRYLLHPKTDVDALRELKEKADFFNQNPELRKEVRVLLSGLNDNDAYQVSALLEDRVLQRPKWFGMVYPDVIAVVALMMLTLVFPFLWVVLVFLFGFNLILHFWNKRNIFQYARSMTQLSLLLDICNQISKKDIPFDKEAALRNSAHLRRFQKKMRWIDFGGKGMVGDMVESLQFIFEMIKALLLIEFRAIYSVARELENKKEAIEGLFSFIGRIDLAITVASLKESGYPLCTPQFTPAYKQLIARKIYHPLIPDCVENDLTVRSKSILITGSNMSGKTTFIRMLAINSIVAQTLYLCFAESYTAPFLQVHSSIRVDDNLLEGKSYYLEEVEIMASLVKAAASEEQNLFILDEIFKGTNTIERVASAKAILSFLNRRKNLVFVATHDIELVELLKAEYDLYYFEENVKDGQLVFDHKLKSGQLHAGNAIRILEAFGYPPTVVKEAKAIAGALLTAKKDGMHLLPRKEV
jgi:hypothetical protein